MLPSFAHLSSRVESVEGADFVTDGGLVVASLRFRPRGQMALVGVRRGVMMQMSAPLEGSHGAARVEYGGLTGMCVTHAGVACARLFLRSAHNRSHTTVLVRNGYMVGRFMRESV